MSDLYRLVYASKNLLHRTETELDQAVAEILGISQRNNAKVGVTGALMFNAGAFAQVLEGPRRGVEDTFERIQRDERHGDVTVLQCGPVESRGFPNWSMAFVGQSAAGRALWDGIAAKSGIDLSRLDGDAVFSMLHELVLDEEGVPATGSALPQPAAASDQPVSALDVERIRAELPQPGQALQAPHAMATNLHTQGKPHEPMRPRRVADTEPTSAALTVLRAALASERQLTTELRNELDEVRVSLAISQEQVDSIRQERDLWLRRAQLLATALVEKADAVSAESGCPVLPGGLSDLDIAA